jgi:hypothetical protein
VFIAGSCDQRRRRLPAKCGRDGEPNLGRKTEILDIRNDSLRNGGIGNDCRHQSIANEPSACDPACSAK